MPLLRVANLGFLLLLALMFAMGNIRVAAWRSIIPLALADSVLDKELRREKHGQRDHVYLLTLAPSGVIQVDGTVYHAVQVGDRLEKDRWSSELQVNSVPIMLHWSRDLHGMLIAMPLTCAVLLVAAVIVWVSRS